MAADDDDRHERETAAFDADATMAMPPAAAPAAPRVPTYPYHPGETILPGYRLEKRLGSGGFGEVWRATAPGGMGVAIKILANLGRAQGGREYRALQTIKNIRHAHIVPIFGVWLKSGDGRVLGEAELEDAERRLLASRGSHWQPERGLAATVDAEAAAGNLDALELVIAMGLGDQTLHDRLKEGMRQGEEGIPADQLVEWMHQAALALDHFNSGSRRGGENSTAVQHCDIKPQNILLVGDAVQVCDFGLARAQGEVRATSNTMASLAYAAPEMVGGGHDPAPSTDQYSLALSYVELRTGRLPYAELSPAAILRAKLDGTLDLSGLGPAEGKIVGRALAVDPARRWQSCVEFVRALRAAAPAGRGGDAALVTGDAAAVAETRDAPTPTAAARPGRGRRVALAALAVTAVSAVAAVGIGGFRAFRGGAVPPTRESAVALERAGRFAAAGEAYARLYAGSPDTLTSVLWNLQTQAADRKRFADCAPLLRRLERLYAASPPPRVKDISRWDVVNSLAWYLATDPAAGTAAAREANSLADESLALAGADDTKRVPALDTAAAAAARAGDFTTAVKRIDEAIAASGDTESRQAFARRRDAYRAGRAWDEP
ncbi:MAG: serine/threonine-protein kinase [Planctomycetaceae bacterium]